jgi:phage tail sheath protein FI
MTMQYKTPGVYIQELSDFFNNGGTQAVIVNLSPDAGSTMLTAADFLGNQATGTGLCQLEGVSLFNILCIPPDTFTTDIDPSVWNAAATYCQQRRAMLIVDPPSAWTTALKAGNLAAITATSLNIPTAAADNVAVYLPRIVAPDPLNDEKPTPCAPCGAVAGVWAQTGASHGVWKAPAGIAATLQGISSLEFAIDDQQNTALTGLGINSLRTLPATGTAVWGARTLGAALAGDGEYTYIPVRRMALFIETCLSEGIKWAVFETNAEPLWAQLCLVIGTFLQALFTQGAFQGATPAQAYFVKCDSETTTQADIDNGVVNITVGFAPQLPAEFVIIEIQQLAGQPPS